MEVPDNASASCAEDADYLRLAAVSKVYGGLTVVDRVSMTIRKGEILTILGPSGCGKTTTLKIIAGFIEPDTGSVLMEGRAVDRLSSHERGAAMVFQNYALFPHLTVGQNIAFGLRMRSQPKADVAKQVDEMLERVRLTPFRHRYPKELSGGQQQRVALARALVIRPKVLLLDEPFSSLDAKLRKQLREEFLDIHRNFHITSVFVTHDLEEAFAISDQVAVMNAGAVEQIGAPATIYSKPRSRFVADFVGHRNLVEGSIIEGGGDGTLMNLPSGLVLRVPATAPGRATASIPVHRLQVAREPVAAANCHPARVAHVACLGPFMQISVNIDGLVLEALQPSTAETGTLRAGERVHVGWNHGDVIVIPAGEC